MRQPTELVCKYISSCVRKMEIVCLIVPKVRSDLLLSSQERYRPDVALCAPIPAVKVNPDFSLFCVDSELVNLPSPIHL